MEWLNWADKSELSLKSEQNKKASKTTTEICVVLPIETFQMFIVNLHIKSKRLHLTSNKCHMVKENIIFFLAAHAIEITFSNFNALTEWLKPNSKVPNNQSPFRSAELSKQTVQWEEIVDTFHQVSNSRSKHATWMPRKLFDINKHDVTRSYMESSYYSTVGHIILYSNHFCQGLHINEKWLNNIMAIE